jgi:hypothetical protein
MASVPRLVRRCDDTSSSSCRKASLSARMPKRFRPFRNKRALRLEASASCAIISRCKVSCGNWTAAMS